MNYFRSLVTWQIAILRTLETQLIRKQEFYKFAAAQDSLICNLILPTQIF